MRLAIVTPWYGRELIGGAERLAWEIAHALARTGAEVEVLSTCCRSFLDDWATNYHRSGVSRDAGGVVLHRFPVDSRDRVAFNRANTVLTTLPRIGLRGDRNVLDAVQTRAFVNENINSRALLAHLRTAGATYDAVIFVPYLYGPALSGAALVADRAFLIPCLHDEAYAYLEPVRALFATVRGVLFNSVGEEETATAIYGPGVLAKSRVIGHAVEPVPPPATPMSIGSFAPHRSRYVLYLGRQDSSKNIDFLIEAFRAFRERRVATSLQLVLAGPRSATRTADGILDLGAVSEPAKAALLTYARALAQPSIHESFSRALYESWFARRPVLVHGECRATARAVEDAGGGWIGTTLEDWVRMFAAVDESADDAVDALGERGWAAALDNGAWDVVARRTLDAISTRLAPPAGPRIENIVPLGDAAVGRYAQSLTDALNAAGADAAVSIAGSAATPPGARIIAHVTASSPPTPADLLVAHDAAPAVIPSGAVQAPFEGRATIFAPNHGVAATLEESGIIARVLPQAVSPAPWAGLRPPHERWLDGKDNLLSIAPLGADEARRLLDTFVAYLALVREARLLIFTADCDGEAHATLLHEREELDLHNEVVLVADAMTERYAAYRAATVALAVGRPLSVESAVTPLWFDLPIVALGDVTVMETVEPCGVVADTFDARRIAALTRIVASDRVLRAAIIGEGRRVRARYAPGVIATAVLEALAEPRRMTESVDMR
ncbi:MAG: glycosyltransferase family 4 protein [Candidatus Lustribacter sp.]|jgi:glycosyltransferase involved in cell wall biosynthesis